MTVKLNPIISWDDEWNINVAEIDADHKKLVSMIQHLFGALITNQGAEHIQNIFFELIDYTRYHFNREEEIYNKHGFPELEEHKIQHRQLIQQVLDVSKKIIAEGKTADLSDELFEFLKSWLVNHILEEDLKFKAFLEQSGTKK
ncbi:MAG: bacteriohemerythrin [Candidatus Neomarinimicrobiota bacterium]